MNVKKFVITMITLMTIVIAWESMPRILASLHCGEQLYVLRNPTQSGMLEIVFLGNVTIVASRI
jgi:hypothetical protein